jgi:hypothetical protein
MSILGPMWQMAGCAVRKAMAAGRDTGRPKFDVHDGGGGLTYRLQMTGVRRKAARKRAVENI